jgi:hypothetical protein
MSGVRHLRRGVSAPRTTTATRSASHPLRASEVADQLLSALSIDMVGPSAGVQRIRAPQTAVRTPYWSSCARRST